MLPAQARLRRRADFDLAVRRGRRASRGSLVVHFLPGATPTADVDPSPVVVALLPGRVGLVVSRAVGPAVVRNRVARQLRHLLRDRLALLGPADRVVVRAQPSARDRVSRDLAVDLDAALRRLGLTSVRPS